MIATVHKGGASFKGVVDYCLSEGRVREDERDELRLADRGQDKAGRVAWSETRNVAAEDPRQAARVMAATASRSEDLKQLSGVKAGGRALEKPVCHYSLSWAARMRSRTCRRWGERWRRAWRRWVWPTARR